MLKSVLLEVAREVLPASGNTRERVDATEGQSPVLLRPRDTAKALSISESQLSKLTRAGKIPCVRINRLVRYDPAAIREWVTLPDSARSFDAATSRHNRSEKRNEARSGQKQSQPRPRRVSVIRPTPEIKKQPMATPAENRKSSPQPDSVRQPRDITGLFAELLGVDRSQFPPLTNGDLMRAAEVDIATMHGWQHFRRDLPDTAFAKLEAFFTSLLKRDVPSDQLRQAAEGATDESE
ncbi:MAG: helix-turn-helix domain-containing protein [Planctomycetes bacterium]|nr:helix-turn-helix domain-containing protein [Planctomycetota bacterium]